MPGPETTDPHDPPCASCDDTGINYQTERWCQCSEGRKLAAAQEAMATLRRIQAEEAAPTQELRDLMIAGTKTTEDLTIPRSKRIEIALRRMVYETVNFSQENDDGSHECRISAPALQMARNALNAKD